jgi:dTDP-4-amino-4,6-dideoxygalactose transaminase
MIPFLDLQTQHQALKPELLAAFARCLDHTGFCLGPEVSAFEEAFARWVGRRHAIGFNSGTSALHVAARLLDLAPGDEVVTTAMTFVATAWGIVYTGARPVFADVEPGTMNVDTRAVEAAITPKTKAIFAVDLYGQCCNLMELERIAARHKITLLEDASQAHGAYHHGRRAGTFGKMAVFSFYPGKNLGACGEGGMLVTDDAALAERARSLRNHGSRVRYHHDEIGYNYRMEGLQAAALSVKLPHLDGWVEKRRVAAAHYRRGLAGVKIELPAEAAENRPAYHLFVVRHPNREGLRAHLEKAGIGTGLHYPIPLHLLDCFKSLGNRAGQFPEAERTARECLSLPMFPELTEEQIATVCAKVREFCQS